MSDRNQTFASSPQTGVVECHGVPFYFRVSEPSNESHARMINFIITRLVHGVSALIPSLTKRNIDEMMMFDFSSWKTLLKNKQHVGTFHKQSDFLTVFPEFSAFRSDSSFFVRSSIGNDSVFSIVPIDFSTSTSDRLNIRQIDTSSKGYVNQTKRCAQCSKVADTRWCAGCHKVKYCCLECQKTHWKLHKADCLPSNDSTSKD